MSDCPRHADLNWNGSLRCKFEARYDTSEPADKFSSAMWATGPKGIEPAMITKTYVHDVCVNCGKKVTR